MLGLRLGPLSPLSSSFCLILSLQSPGANDEQP